MNIIQNIKRAWAAFREEPRRAPEMAETASMRNDLAMLQWKGPSDEIMMIDPLLRLSGTDSFTDVFDVYREMLLKWPHARHCLRKRQNAVLARPLQITAASDDERDVAIAEFVRRAIEGITEFRDDLRELLDAVWFGFAVSEIIWDLRPFENLRAQGRGIGPMGHIGPMGQIKIQKIMSRAPERFRFGWDGGLMVDSSGMRMVFEAAPLDKFVVHSYNKENEIPYGWGEGRYTYWYYFFAKNALKFWSLFTEKFAAPTVVGKHPPGVAKTEQDALMNALKAFQNDQAVRIPDNMVIELIEATRSGSLDCYDSYISYLERSVSKMILGGTLQSEESRFGTRAQAEVHERSGIEFTDADCEALSGTLKSQLITPLVRYNFGNDAAVPGCSFEGDDTEDLKARAETDQLLVGMGVPLGLKYFYETYGRPAPEEGEATTKNETGNGGMGESEIKRFGERSKIKDQRSKGEEEIAKGWRENEDRFVGEAIKRGGRFYLNLMDEIRGMFERAVDESGAWAIQGGMFDVDVAPLANYLGWAVFTGQLNGLLEIQELSTTVARREFAEKKGNYVFEPLEPREAVEWFEGLLPLTKDEFDQLLWGARQQAFTVADIQSRDVIAKVQDSLTKAISEGKTFEVWKKEIASVFESEGVTEKSDFRMRTIFQTNVHNALVEGRDRMMGNLAQQGVIKLARWQGVDDSRERDVHRAFNDQVFAWDDVSVWRHLKDYNCRCMKVPVFK